VTGKTFETKTKPHPRKKPGELGPKKCWRGEEEGVEIKTDLEKDMLLQAWMGKR